MASPRSHEVPSSDGRLRRGERSREAIVAALFELVGEGVLQPTAQQVAERAGVGIRSVFGTSTTWTACSRRWTNG